MGKHKRHLRNYILDKGLQLRYIGVVTLLSAAICSLLGWIIATQRSQSSLAVIHSLAGADFISARQKAEIVEYMMKSDASVVLHMLLICAGLIFVMSMFLVVMTHKVAGPLHVVGLYLDKLAAGKLPQVHDLRHGDELHNFHKKFQGMCNELRARAQADVTAYNAFVTSCRAAKVDESGALGHAIEDLEKQAKEKEAALG